MTAPGRYPIPAWRVVLDGQDLTDRIQPRLLDLRITECRGGEADEIGLTIHDHDRAMALPRRGVILAASIGWQGGVLVGKGTFRVDEVEYQGAPDTITIRARSADLTAELRTRRDRSWHAATLGDVLRNIAGAHGLTPRIAPALAAVAIDHLDQTGESDANLLTRLGKRWDAVATVKAGCLLFTPIGSGQTATGKPLQSVHITRADGDRHRYTTTDRDAYSGVRAGWHDKGEAKRKTVLAGTAGNVKSLRTVYASEQVAREHAEAEFRRLKRGAAQLSLTLALGRADLSPEQAVTVSGFKPEIDGASWLVSKVEHSVSGSDGFTTTLELETG